MTVFVFSNRDVNVNNDKNINNSQFGKMELFNPKLQMNEFIT